MKIFLAAILASLLVIATSKLGEVTDGLAPKPFLRPSQLGDVWTNCTKSDGILTINRVTISPDTIKAGQAVNVLASYTLNTQIDDGTLNININLAGDQHNLSVDLCYVAFPLVGIKCPLVQTTSGLFNITQIIPAEAPQGHYTAKITATTKDDVEFMCVLLDFMMG